MPVREAPERRGRARRGNNGLLERESVLAAIEAALDAATQGTGEALLIEGHAGMGKTRLHEAALDSARARGMRVLRAAGAELEGEIAFGVAAALLSAQLQVLSPSAREAALGVAPEQVRALAGRKPAGESDAVADLALAHGLFTLIATAEESRPTLIALDDLHWCDTASLGFFLYMLHRLQELPVALVMTRRPAPGHATSPALDRIATHPRVRVEALSALGDRAVGELARQALGERADEALVEACHEATAGNPFYVRELLLALNEEHALTSEQLAEHARALAPPAVIRILRVRVGLVGPAGSALARAVAVLGDDAQLRHAAELAGLSMDRAADAADALAAVEILLAREPLRFVHPLVRQAIANDIPASELASRHLEAARLLYREGAEPERIAAHLLLGRAQGERWAVEQLRDAARDARTRGSAHSAVRYLRRALEEPPVPELRGAVLAELGGAESAAGLPSAAARLAQALAVTHDPRRRAELLLARGHALYAQGLHEQAAGAYEGGLAELPAEPAELELLELHDALQTGFVAAGSQLPELHARSAERSAQLLDRASEGPRTHGQRQLLAQAAVHSAFAGEPAGDTIELARRAWDSGKLLAQDTSDGAAWSLVVAAVCWAGAFERCHELLEDVFADARRRASPHAFATASYFRGSIELFQGRVTEACADLELARDARRYGWGQFARGADALHCLCLIEAGELDHAGEMLVATEPLAAPRDLDDALRLLARAELLLARGDAKAALADALAVQLFSRRSIRVLGLISWQVTAAQAALALGDRTRALGYARAESELAERTGALHARIRARRALGLCESGEAGLGLLRSAAALGSSAVPRLESIRTLVDLGAALRRGNRRADAREPLQRAADLALEGGAHALHERARTELAATGARPRRERLLSGPASLTPSERRIADLAAAGHSNREIGQALFVTPKTVEYHLRNVFRKLDVDSRRELPRALSQ